jgi:hypothetical protein
MVNQSKLNQTPVEALMNKASVDDNKKLALEQAVMLISAMGLGDTTFNQDAVATTAVSTASSFYQFLVS